MFLSHENLCDLTGFKSTKKQAEWLCDNGYAFDIRADGRPCVLTAQLLERRGCHAQTGASNARPNLSWIPTAPRAN
ncbi:MAG: DUF4224 domain-containing protein [Pseudomonadota bacterium]